MKTIIRRLQKLELRIPPSTEVVDLSGADVLAEWLAGLGIVRGPNESLAETTARAMGISGPELWAELQRRAWGITI